jgi:hypothetical protein
MLHVFPVVVLTGARIGYIGFMALLAGIVAGWRLRRIDLFT